LPTWALQQVGRYLRFSGRDADLVATAAGHHGRLLWLQPIAAPACCMFELGKMSREIPMLKAVVGLVAALFVAGSVHAQEASHVRLTPDDLKALTEARIAATKDVLKLTPEQARLWPPIENAIRARADVARQSG